MVLEDGRRENLPHPGEERAAKHQTGLRIRQLRKLDRIGRRNAYTCERCFVFQLYADDEVVDVCPSCANKKLLLLGNLIGKRESHLSCTKCKSGSLILKATGKA